MERTYSISDLVVLEEKIKARIPSPPETGWGLAIPTKELQKAFNERSKAWSDKHKKEHQALYKIQQEIMDRLTFVIENQQSIYQ